jgi:hypothetical protein
VGDVEVDDRLWARNKLLHVLGGHEVGRSTNFYRLATMPAINLTFSTNSGG